MDNRRFYGWLLLGVLVCVALFESTPSYAAESPVTITFLHGWDRERTDLMNEVLHRFEEKYPWIKVDAHLVPTNDLGEQLTVLMAAGLPPDLTMVSGGNSVNLGVRGMLMPLGEFVAREQLVLDEIFYPPVANALVNNPIAGPGNFYYLPQLVDTNWYLFYNKGHFAEAGLDVEAPPRTWSELEAIARRLNRADADSNWVQLGIDVVQTTYNQMFGEWLSAAGGRMYSDDLRRVTVGDSDNQGLTTLEWMVRFTNEVNGGIAAQERVNRYARSGFYNEQMSMLLNGAWSYFQILENAPSIDVGVASIPHRDGFDYRPSMSLGWGYGIPSTAAHPEEAWLLLKFLTIELDGGGYFVLRQGRPGATMEINLQPEYPEANPYWHVIQESFNRSVPAEFAPSVSGTGSLGRQMVDSVVRGQLSPQAAMEQLVTTWQARLDDFWRSLD